MKTDVKFRKLDMPVHALSRKRHHRLMEVNIMSKMVTEGFRKVGRDDEIFQEFEHDPYRAKGKLREPSVCSQCGAVFHKGRWQWLPVPEDAHRAVCPACSRIHDHYPAGFLTLQGEFFNTHHDEIIQLLKNLEKRERAEHPLKRIMAVEEKDGTALVTTTDIHLARSFGDALHHAYQGELEYHYNDAQYLLRLKWSR